MRISGINMLWSAERQLMRLEALLASNPNAAVHWRTQVALMEAVRSTELDQHILDPTTLLLALMQQKAARSRSDAAAVQQAEAIWHAVTNSTSSEADFATSASIGSRRLQTIYDEPAHFGEISSSDILAWAMSKIEQLGGSRWQPLLPRLAAIPHVLREINRERSPIAELLWVMLADQKWRPPAPFIGDLRLISVRGEFALETPDQPRWINAPSSVLSLKGPGQWYIDSPDFGERFIRSANAWLKGQVDSFLSIARWEAMELRAFACLGRNGARRALTQLLARTPIVDAPLVARQLKVHTRTACRILNEAAEAGVVMELIGRYQFRIWAAPSLAQWALSTHQDRRKRLSKVARPPGRYGDETGCEAEVLRSLPQQAGAFGSDEELARKDARLQAMFDEIDALSKGMLEISNKAISAVECKSRAEP